MEERVIPPPPWEAEAKNKGIPPPPWEEKPKKRFPVGSQSRRSEANIRNIQVEQAAADQKQGERDAYGHALGQAAEMLPFAVAAPFTGGASLPVGLGLMSAAGVAGGLMREGTKAVVGSSDIPQTPKALAATLGVDAVTGMVGEATGRGIGAVFKELIPKLVVRSAAKDQLGRTLLTQAFDKTRGEISTLAPGVHADVTGSYLKFFNEVATLPAGTGKLGARLTKLTPKAQAIFSDVGKDLNIAQGTVSNAQPLDALIEMRGRLNQIAWDKEALGGREQAIMQRFADNLDKDIRSGLRTVGPEAEALYNKANAIWKIQMRQEIGTRVVENALSRMTSRGLGAGVIGGVGGGIYGGRKGGVEGAVKGAAEGAIGGAAIGMASAAPPKISAWVLERLMAHPQAAKEVGKAIDFYAKGQTDNAASAIIRGVTVARIRNDIKAALEQPPEP